MANHQHSRLEELGSNSIDSIEVPHDLRNYIVKNAEENTIGKVSDLLYDIKSRKVRYLVIELDANANSLNSRKILAPVGTVDFYEIDNYLVISSLNTALIDALPDYIIDQVNPGVENIVRLAFAGESNEADCSGLTGNDILIEEDSFYNHFHFDFSRLFGKKDLKNMKVVSGVFDDSLEAENSISELLSHGFSRDIIELNSGKKEEESPDITNGGSIVSVKIDSDAEALKVSEILDKNGSISVYEKSI